MTPAEMAWQEWWKERELGNKLCMGDAGIVRAAFLAGAAHQRAQDAVRAKQPHGTCLGCRCADEIAAAITQAAGGTE